MATKRLVGDKFYWCSCGMLVQLKTLGRHLKGDAHRNRTARKAGK